MAIIWWLSNNPRLMLMTLMHWRHSVTSQKGLHQLTNDGPQQWHTPKLLKRLKGGSQNETVEEEESWGMFPNSKHFRGRRMCLSSRMGLGWTHKREFKMRSTCTTKKRGKLVQVEWKWCDGRNRDNFKHKLYITYNLWEEAPLSSL